MKNLLGALFVSCFLFIGLGACGQADELYDCTTLCTTYGECAEELGQDVDETSCIDECATDAEQDEGFAQEADECAECLRDVDTCTDAFPCVDECAGVIPDFAF